MKMITEEQREKIINELYVSGDEIVRDFTSGRVRRVACDTLLIENDRFRLLANEYRRRSGEWCITDNDLARRIVIMRKSGRLAKLKEIEK